MAVGRKEEAASEAESAWFIDYSFQEAKVPALPEGTVSTASLFCIEDFGVRPPPETGWVPRDEENARGEKKEVEWYRNVKTSDWIYHHTESMYYHLPTSSLWERRVVECVVKGIESHTYARADSNVLQALSRFALSLDVGLVPMAFKAWVRYMRKKKDKHFGMQPPAASPTGTSSNNKATADNNEKAPAESKQDDVAPSMVLDAQKSLAKLQQSRSSCWTDEQQEDLLEPRDRNVSKELPAGSEVTQTEEIPRQAADNSTANQPDSEDEPLNGGAKKGLFCLRCFGNSRTGSKKKMEAPLAPPDPVPTNSTAADRKQSPEATSTATPSRVEPGKETGNMEKRESARDEAKGETCITSVERHLRRLDAFLDLVVRNPQRLVNHIENRRQGKSTSLGQFIA